MHEGKESGEAEGCWKIDGDWRVRSNNYDRSGGCCSRVYDGRC